jgi:SOS-response transcriptional repressor LexA
MVNDEEEYLVSGDKLRVLRKRRKLLSRAELAIRADLAISAIQTIENSPSYKPRGKTIRKLAKGLDMEPMDLLEQIRVNGDDGADTSGIGDVEAVGVLPTYDIDVAAGPWSHATVCELNADDPEQARIIKTGRFRLRISGNCMEPDYPSGSVVEFVILRYDEDALQIGRDYVICKSDNTATFKRLIAKHDDTLSLAPLNQRDHPGIVVVDRQEIGRIAVADFIVAKLGPGKIPKIRKP